MFGFSMHAVDASDLRQNRDLCVTSASDLPGEASASTLPIHRGFWGVPLMAML